jgi:hypothetical protein
MDSNYTSTVPFTTDGDTTHSSMMSPAVNQTISPVDPDARSVDQMLQAERYLWILLSPVILLVGLVGNVLNLVVLVRMQFTKNVTLLLIFSLAIVDIVALCTGLSRYWIKYTFEYDVRLVSDFGCKLNLFVIYVSMQYSSWILVSVTVVRFLKTVIPLKARKYQRFTDGITIFHALIVLAVVFGALSLINMHFFWTNGITADGDCGSLTPTYLHFDEFIFVWIDFVVLSVLPFSIMLFCNCFILHALYQLKRPRGASFETHNRTLEPKGVLSRMTRMLVVASTYFLLATLPISVYFIVDSYVRPNTTSSLEEARLDIAWAITYIFQYSNFAVNFYIYTATNQRFRHELKMVLSGMFHR